MAQIIAEDLPEIGGRIAGWCHDTASQTICVVSWTRGDLLATTALLGPSDAVDLQVTQDLLVEMVPTIVANLLAYEPGGVNPDPDGGIPPVTGEDAPTFVTAAAPPPTSVVATTAAAPAPATAASAVPTTVFSKS